MGRLEAMSILIAAVEAGSVSLRNGLLPPKYELGPIRN